MILEVADTGVRRSVVVTRPSSNIQPSAAQIHGKHMMLSYRRCRIYCVDTIGCELRASPTVSITIEHKRRDAERRYRLPNIKVRNLYSGVKSRKAVAGRHELAVVLKCGVDATRARKAL